MRISKDIRFLKFSICDDGAGNPYVEASAAITDYVTRPNGVFGVSWSVVGTGPTRRQALNSLMRQAKAAKSEFRT